MIASLNDLVPGTRQEALECGHKQSVYLPPAAARRIRQEADRVGMSYSGVVAFCVAFTIAHLDEARQLMEPVPKSMAAIHPRTVTAPIT